MAKAKYTKGADGYFSTKAWDGTYNPDGTKHRANLRSKKSSRDLENQVNALAEKVKSRKYTRKTDIMFVEYARQWKAVYKDPRENGTKSMYSNIIEKHFIAMAHVKLQDIGRIHLQMLLNNAAGKTRTQAQIQMTFYEVLRSAVADHLFPANALEDIIQNTERVKYVSPEKRPLTSVERKAVFKAAFQEQDKIFVFLLYGCGIRRGEALALTVFDVLLSTHELKINKAHEFIDNNPSQKSPKSDNGYRLLPIPDLIFPDVERYVSKLIRQGKTYLFTMRNGKPVTKSSYDKMWARILRRMQEVSDEPITGLTAHVFRHNYCTNLCYQIPTISIKRIAQLLGDTEKMVLEVYNHIILEKEDAATAVNNAINF